MGSRIWTFDWYQTRWPSITLNSVIALTTAIFTKFGRFWGGLRKSNWIYINTFWSENVDQKIPGGGHLFQYVTNQGTEPFRSRANSLTGANRLIGPWPIRSLEHSFLGPFAPWPFGANWPGSKNAVNHQPATQGQLSLPSLRGRKWVPALAGRPQARRPMVHSISGWTRGAGKTEITCEHVA